MKYFIPLFVLLFIGCATKQVQQNDYRIKEYIQEYIDSQNVEVEDETIMD